MKLKAVIGYDSNDGSVVPWLTLLDSAGRIVEAEVEVRDYGHGDTPDESGALYERVEPS